MSKTDLKGVKITKETIETDLVTKVLFKSIVYRLINKVETFMDFGGIPNQDEFPAFLSYLKAKVKEKVVIFTAAHQNMGFRRLMDTFSYLAKNIDKLTYNVVKGANHRSTKQCQEAILKRSMSAIMLCLQDEGYQIEKEENNRNVFKNAKIETFLAKK